MALILSALLGAPLIAIGVMTIHEPLEYGYFAGACGLLGLEGWAGVAMFLRGEK